MVLFIHGLFGDAFSTWMNSSGQSWLDLMEMDKAFSSFDIGTVSYPTPIFSRASTIEEISTRLLADLEDYGLFQKYTQIYFVGHSMGGLILKRMLVRLNRPNAKALEKLRRVKAAIYISTPAQGAEIAQLATWISANPQLRDLSPSDLNSYLQALEHDWTDLIKDRAAEPWPRSYCAYETLPTRGIVIVPRVYSLTFCDNDQYAVDENHETIVKPTDISSAIHVWIRSRIQEAGAQKGSEEIARLVASRIDLDILRKKYPLGFIVYFSDGRIDSHAKNLQYLANPKIEVIIRPAMMSLLEVTPTTAKVLIPDVTYTLANGAIVNANGNFATISRKTGSVFRYMGVSNIRAAIEVVWTKEDLLVWVFGFYRR